MEADVVKLVDTLVLGTSALSREGSSPFIRTNKEIARLQLQPMAIFVGMQPHKVRQSFAQQELAILFTTTL